MYGGMCVSPNYNLLTDVLFVCGYLSENSYRMMKRHYSYEGSKKKRKGIKGRWRVQPQRCYTILSCLLYVQFYHVTLYLLISLCMYVFMYVFVCMFINEYVYVVVGCTRAIKKY